MKLKKITIWALLLFSLFFTFGFEREDDSYEDNTREKASPVNSIFNFNLLDINIIDVGISSFKHNPSMSMGATWDKNLSQKLLFHSQLVAAFPEIIGIKIDLGLGYILSSKKGIDDYNQVGWIDSGSTRTYYHSSGKARINSIHSFDFGIRQYMLSVSEKSGGWESTEWETKDKCFDSIFYFGYRYDYIVDKFMPIEQWTFSIHGMVGLINQSEYKIEDGTVITDNKRNDIAWGIKARIKWWWMEFEGGYFDNQFYMESGLIFSFNFF